MPMIAKVVALHAEMTAWRRDFHAHPELALQEKRTAALVAERLTAFGVDEVHTGLARTGVVGVIRGRAAGDGAIGLRADMDALPIREATGLPYASTNDGLMHACGHDGHTTMLLGAARYLAETRNFAGTAYVIFQPAEEDLGGGDIMVREGLFERFPMRQVFGLHNWPGQPGGRFFWRDGPLMAAAADIDITITGRGGHGAHPDRTVDPIVIAAHIVTALQSVVSRRLDPLDAGVVSFGHISAGQAYNVIPETVRLKGTARWFVPAVRETLESGVRTLTTQIAAAFGASAEVMFRQTCPATVNEPAAMAQARASAERVVGADHVHQIDKPSMGAEDFAFMLERLPGSYIILGAGRTAEDPGLHNPGYDFNDDILPLGASYWATLVEQRLPL